jgi:hypothetical protein
LKLLFRGQNFFSSKIGSLKLCLIVLNPGSGELGTVSQGRGSKKLSEFHSSSFKRITLLQRENVESSLNISSPGCSGF